MLSNRIPQQLLEKAAIAGADAAEVYQMRSCSDIACFEANDLKQLERVELDGTALRVWQNHQPGLAVTQGPFDLDELVTQALSLSKLYPPQPINLSRSQLIHETLNRGHRVPTQQLIEWGQDAIAYLIHLNPDLSCSAEYECESEQVYLTNSAGMECGYTDITLSSFLTAEWFRDQDFLCIEANQIQRENLEHQQILTSIEQRLNWASTKVSPPKGPVPVLLTSRATEILWSTVQAALNGKRVLDGASPWSNRLYEVVADTRLNVSQVPDYGPYSCPFDDEGMPTRSLDFLRNGQLQMFYTDQCTGQFLGSGSTGNGFRSSLNSYPAPEVINLVVQPGSASLAQMMDQIEDGLIVDQVLGDHSAITGDLSINVDLGYRIKQGQVAGRVKDVMLVGNVYKLLSSILALGNDNQWNDIYYSPSMLVTGFSLAS